MTSRPAWGHGRIDPFNPVKFDRLGMAAGRDATIGNSDMMPLWRLDERRTAGGEAYYHWDGLNTDLREVVLAGAIGDGATHRSLPVARLDRLTEWLRTFHPARENGGPADLLKYPFEVDRTLAAEGEKVFRRLCAECHARDGARANEVVPVAEIGTDPNRLEMWNPASGDDPHPADRYNAFADGYDWDLRRFRKTDGYVAPPLTAIWLRAPYLHNGSVPTLWDLLLPSLPPREAAELVDGAAGAPLAARLRSLLGRAEAPPLSAARVRSELNALEPAVRAAVEAARKRGVRPPIFYRGSNVLTSPASAPAGSEERIRGLPLVGFLHTRPELFPSPAADGGARGPGAGDQRKVEDRRAAVPYFVLVPGNANRGHEGTRYGTTLPEQDRRALVEYLKTL